jgi:lipoprotein-releasing system permease protein
MPGVLTLVFLLFLALSGEFRVWYVSAAPRLRSAWFVALVVLAGAWFFAGVGMAFLSPVSLRSPNVYFAALGSFLYFSDLIWCSAPAAVGISRLLKHRTGSLTKFLLVFGLFAFVGLAYLTTRLPDVRGGAWSAKDFLIRLGAVLAGVIALASLIGQLLPRLLNVFEGRSFPFFVGARHIRAEKSGFLTVISLLSIMGVSLSSCTLFTVSSVMGGFSSDLKRKILGNSAHIVIDTESRTTIENYDDIVGRITAVPGVVGATPVVHGESIISSGSNIAGVMVRGVDAQSIPKVIDLEANIEVGRLAFLTHPEELLSLPNGTVIGFGMHGDPVTKGPSIKLIDDTLDPEVRAALLPGPVRPGIIIGRELAKTIHVMLGDEVTLVSPLGDLGPMGMMPRTKRFRVAAIFYSGMYEYDASHVYVTLGAAQEYFQAKDRATVIDVKVDSAERVERYMPSVTAAIQRPELRVRDWREINKNLFSALKLEKFATFIILSIAIIVASFCIICTLLLMVTEKGKEIAILKALGASDRMIQRTFMIEGMIIGATGTTFGMMTGLGLCGGASFFGVKLDPEVYYIDRLPINVSGWEFLGVTLASLAICTLSTIYPARAASSLRPVEGLRHE